MEKIENLYEKRKLIATEIDALADLMEKENRSLNVDEQEKAKNLKAEFNVTKDLIERAEFNEYNKEIKNEIAKPIGDTKIGRNKGKLELTNKTHELALHGWMKSRMGMRPNAQELEASKLAQFSLSSPEATIKLSRNPAQFRNTLITTDGPHAGYLINQGFSTHLEIALEGYGGMREACTVWRTPSGNETIYPEIDDTMNDALPIAEEQEITFADPTASQVIFRAYKFGRAIKVSEEMLADSFFDLSSVLGTLMGESLGRKLNQVYTNSNGVASPMGLTNVTTAGATAASATAITLKELNGLIYSVDAAYLDGPKVGFMMHSSVWNYIENLFLDNTYFAANNIQGKVQRRLLGYPVWFNNHLPGLTALTPATGQKLVWFGDFSKFILREVGTATLVTARERYIETGHVAFFLKMRVDSNLVDANAGAIKHLVQA